MRTIRTIIVDDEPLACRRILRMVKEDPDIEVVDMCKDGASAIDSIAAHTPDLVFLDIQMPDMNGFDVLKSLAPEIMPSVIFVTAYDEFALDAFEMHAFDYLLKPVEIQRLQKALMRVKTYLGSYNPDNTNREILRMLTLMQGNKYIDRVAVKEESRVLLIKVQQIEWIESEGKYLNLHCGGKSHLIRHTLRGIESRLDPMKFLRIHKQVIINIDYIKELQPWFHGDYRIILASGKELSLSRRFKHRFREYLEPSAWE